MEINIEDAIVILLLISMVVFCVGAYVGEKGCKEWTQKSTEKNVSIENLPTAYEVAEYANGSVEETLYKGTYPRERP